MIGLVTTDQGPNAEFVQAFQRTMPDIEIRLVGALDDLSMDEIEALAARPSPYPIQTILADGTTRDIDISVLVPLVDSRAHEMVERGAGVIAVCCAGDFPDIDCGVPVLYPGRLLSGMAGAVAATRRIGVVSPIASQMESARRNWERDGFDVKMAFASAFRKDEIETAAREMSDPALEVVVLDCMDHTAMDRDEFARLCGRPVLAALSLTAQVASEILGG
ncbi:MAG: AroM family protein [Dehalococcoidia bacterium]|jgi:protein AroM|nr:AroM family protein [Dehalococcoidia bacterium]